VGKKNFKLPRIRDLHVFVAVAVPPNKIVMKVHGKRYSGTLRDSPTKVKKDVSTDLCIPRVTDSYKARGNLRSLKDSKLGHLKQMYANFIAEEKWPDFVNFSVPHCKNVYDVLYVYVYISPKMY